MKCDTCGQPLDEDKQSGKYPLTHLKCSGMKQDKELGVQDGAGHDPSAKPNV